MSTSRQACPRARRQAVRGVPLALAALVLVLCADPVHAYIGPGAGFAVIGSFLAIVLGVALGALVLATWPTRALARALRRRRAFRRSLVRRVVVLGLDGLDPELAEEMMAAGKLPNFAALRKRGSYTRLETTCPAMSPVAWSSFMTGTGPGRHGIYDFLHRDPRTYLPILSSVQIRASRRALRIGALQIPLGPPVLRILRRSKPVWTILGEHGIASTVLRVPITFPPEPFHGLLLSGMCVPDLIGTQGSFALFTSDPEAGRDPVGGRRLPLVGSNGVFSGRLPGPPRWRGAQGDASAVPFRLIATSETTARLEICRQRIRLAAGEYSDWVPVTFRLGPGKRAAGICRFYLKRTAPSVDLYASPINIDPERPSLPISHPQVFSVYLAKRLGPFATLGLAEDTWALNEGVLDDRAFLLQCQLVFDERRRMLMGALRNTTHGCVICVFDTTDRIQHMFWRYRDRDHPARDQSDRSDLDGIIESAYEQADALVGEVLGQLSDHDALFVMSDHGFASFRRGVNLNAWLLREGYLHLQPGAQGEATWLHDVDWEHTRAYAIGLGGLYLNIAGRESRGVVPPEEMQALRRELAEKLTGIRDEENGASPIKRVFDTAKTHTGPYSDVGPDLTIGYARGYRASWDGAQGRVAGPVIEDNTRRWSGDHCCDPALVPGVLFSSRPLTSSPAHIMDIAPSILALFGVRKPPYMQGRSLLLEASEETAADA